MAISRDDQLALALQRLEEDEVHNLEKKEHMIMRDGKFAIMMQHKEEDKAQKSMEKEQRAMTSTTRSECPFLAPFSSVFHTPELGVPSKVTTLEMDSMFFFADHLLHLQAVFRVAEKNATVDVG